MTARGERGATGTRVVPSCAVIAVIAATTGIAACSPVPDVVYDDAPDGAVAADGAPIGAADVDAGAPDTGASDGDGEVDVVDAADAHPDAPSDGPPVTSPCPGAPPTGGHCCAGIPCFGSKCTNGNACTTCENDCRSGQVCCARSGNATSCVAAPSACP